MREIKFMAWDKKLKRLISNEEFAFSPYFIQADGKVIICDPGNEKHNFEELKDYIVLQYTGLKDKNGKEIYEGQILKHESLTHQEVVEWKKEMWTEEGFMTGFGEWFGTANQYKIIGNIYENPELLKKKPA